MNQFIVHSSLDIVEEVQWTSNTMYLVPVYYPADNKVHEDGGQFQQ